VRRTFRRRLGGVVAALLLLAGLLFILVPYFWLFTTAFKQPIDAFAIPPVFPFQPTLDNFGTLFGGPFLSYIGNSVIVTVLTTALALLLGTPAGYALARSHSRSSGAMGQWLLVSYAMPPLVFVIPLFLVFFRIGLINTYPGLVLGYETGILPFTVWMMRSYFLDVPVELEDAARIDGCSRLQAFVRVILPVSRAGLVTVGLLVAIAAWNEYFGALILSGPDTMTAPLAIYGYIGTTSSNWSAMAAGGVIVIVPILFMTLAAQRGLLRGLTAGAVTG
jgi:multiple sugar transport system permease protein